MIQISRRTYILLVPLIAMGIGAFVLFPPLVLLYILLVGVVMAIDPIINPIINQYRDPVPQHQAEKRIRRKEPLSYPKYERMQEGPQEEPVAMTYYSRD